MNFQNFILNCRNPRVVENKCGPVTVGCGKCTECLSRKVSHNTLRSFQEMCEAEYNYFITLTYNDINAPRVKVVYNKEARTLHYIDKTRRRVHPRNPKSKFQKSSTYGEVISTLYRADKRLFDKFYQKRYKKSNIYKELPYTNLFVLSKTDLQKFFKRLRFQCRAKFDAEVRYFAVGEYTPKHFRPHYHIILSFNDMRLCSQLENIVTECWQYGRSDTEPSRDCQGSSSYLSGYLNSYTKLPIFLKDKSIAPFVCHSKFLGIRNIKKLSSFVYSFDRYPFEPIELLCFGQPISINLSGADKYYFFPRCYNYELQTLSKRRTLYTIYERLCNEVYQRDETPSIRVLVQYIYCVHHNIAYKDLFDALEVPLSDFSGSYQDFLYYLDNPDANSYFMKLYHRFYSAILLSKEFYKLCKSCSYHPNELISKIEDFYFQLNQYRLSQQYIHQDIYTSVYDDNVSFFYDIDALVDNSLIKAICIENDFKLEQKIKHKELNDANDIFCN